MKTTYLELYRNVDAGLVEATSYETLAEARKDFALDKAESLKWIFPLAILQIDVDDNNKVTVTEVPAEEPREYWYGYIANGAELYKLIDVYEGIPNLPPEKVIYVRNVAGGLDVVTGEERQSVIDRFFK